ncbi:hypothetical protein HID58_055496, partial [Brassica napus]
MLQHRYTSLPMAKRFSAADKGKSIVGNPSVPPRIRIHAPDFDLSELIKENMLTLVVMEPTLDFNTGEESVITLEYERLGNHCSTCFWLSHLQSQCPERESGSEKPQSEPHRNCPRYLDTLADTRSSSRDPRSHVIPLARPFQQRITSTPAYSRRRLNHQGEVREDGSSAENHHSPRLQWRANSPTADQEATSQQRQ